MNRPQRSAIVTGGARRIGRAIVEDLAAHGWAVAIHSNTSRDAADALAALIIAAGGRAAVVTGDLADLEVAPQIIRKAAEALGPLSLLVNNASVFEEDHVGTLTPEQFNRQMTINFASPVFLTQAFAQTLDKNGEGCVVNLTDQRALRTAPTYFSYQMSKSALWTATRTMAQALAPRIRVNAVAPGPVLRNVLQPTDHFETQTSHLPLGRGPDLTEFGRTVRYLVENRSVTGQMIALDGGQHLVWDTPDMADFEL
jgi:NAD(P)-dependent dehydrogenase (short-subunit alcohol dehydrogenase family)